MGKTADKRRGLCFWAGLLLTAGWAAVAWPRGEDRANVVLDVDARSFTFSVPRTLNFQGGFSAEILRGGQTQALYSTEGKLGFPIEHMAEDTPFGSVDVTEATLRFEKEKVNLVYRFGRTSGRNIVLAQVGVCNRGFLPFRLSSVTPLILEGRVEGPSEEWLITALDTSVKDAPSVVTLREMEHPITVFEYGGFYRHDGKGFLFGPVGTPTAYVQASIAHKGDGNVVFVFVADMSGVEVKPGETRWGQQVALVAEPPLTALPCWAEWVAQTHGARTEKGALSGWNSWSFHGNDVTGKDVMAEVEAVLKSSERLRPGVMEIDAGFPKSDEQPMVVNEKFPEGLPFYAQKIASTGARPGILLNFRGPPGFDGVAEKIRAMVQCGFTDIKINKTGFAFPEEDAPDKTSFERMREGFAALRTAAGPGTYLMYNVSRPERASVGLMDANRTAACASRNSVRDAMPFALRSYHLNGRWFAVDTDSYYMGTDIANVSAIAGGWPLVRTWMSMVGLSSGAAVTADPWHWESFRPYWRNVEVMTPPACQETKVLDLCTSREWPRLVGHVKREWGDMHVALLWNPGTSERTVTLDFAKVGMHPKHRYAVWSFWDNRYLGVVQGLWKTPALGPSDSQHLRFTDLDRASEKPLLIGSSLHIYCGAAEIKQVSCRRGAMEIELTDAGARDGDLFIYSRRQPVWKGAVGCTVAEIASAGENVWRISLVGRKRGVPQRVVLGILLPVTQQIWFWALCGSLAASVVFGTWRYLASARMQLALAQLQQQSMLQQDRARIARDLHDELGSGLTRILMMSDLRGKGDLRLIHRTTLALTRELDEIVWAVNPKNDRLDSLALFLDSYSQEVMDLAGITSRVDFPVPMPSRTVTSQMRHTLFLAFKEALTNIIRHSGAKRVHIKLTVKPKSLLLSLEDDGHGFSVDGARTAGSASGHDGLENMNTRLAAVGGRFTITSEPGRGTRVEFELPLEP